MAQLIGGGKPRVRNKEEFDTWLANYVSGLNRNAEPSGTPPNATPPNGTPSSGTNVYVTGRKPWLVKFTGDGGDAYELWRHQVTCLQQEQHSSRDIKDAIRSSLQGKAGGVLVRLGAEATVTEILKKMDTVFGEINTEGETMAEFYSATQDAQESIADWACRLEKLYGNIPTQLTGTLPRDTTLKNRLWSGLRKELKDITAYHYEKATSFDDLQVMLRRVENKPDQKKQTKGEKGTAKTIQVERKQDELGELKAMVRALTTEVADMKKVVSGGQQGQAETPRGGHTGRGRGRRDQQPIICRRCGEEGHIAIGCRMRVDHLRKDPFRRGSGRGSNPGAD